MQIIFATIIGFFMAGLFYFLFYRAFILAFGKNFIKQNFNHCRWLVFCGVALLGLLVCIFATSQNSGIYDWDHGGYWYWSYTFTDELYTDPGAALQHLYTSINETDYNLILPTIISFPLHVLGYSFLRYTVINYLLFIIPTLFILFCLFVKLINQKQHQRTSKYWLLALIVPVCFTIIFIPLLMGYIDVAILIPISLLFALFLQYSPTKPFRSQVSFNIVIGLLLLVTFLFRRYAAFFVVGFLGALFIYTLYTLFSSKKNKTKKVFTIQVKNTILNFLSLGGTALIVLFAFFSPLVFRILQENYSELYSAYNPSLGEKFSFIIEAFGIFFLILAGFAVIYSLIKRRLRKITVFCLVSIIITVVTFFRVQAMGIQHLYTISIQILILDFLGLYFIISLRPSIPSTIIKYSCISILLFGPFNCFCQPIHRQIQFIQLLFSTSYQPLYHPDLAELQALRDYLNDNSDGNNIYVLASSTILNSDILKTMNRPAQDNAVGGLVKSHDVDLRDGFPNIFFTAHTVVTTDPIQTHLNQGSQEVIRYLAEQIQDPNSYLGRHFTRDTRSFNLDQGVTAYIYHKVSPLTDEDYDQLITYFDTLYPNYKDKFGDRINQFKLESHSGTSS